MYLLPVKTEMRHKPPPPHPLKKKRSGHNRFIMTLADDTIFAGKALEVSYPYMLIVDEIN